MPQKFDESIIAKDACRSCDYAKYVIKGRWQPGEAAIAQNAQISYFYARDVVKGRFRLGEPIILQSPEYAFCYAKDVIKSPWTEAEQMIAQDAHKSYLYAQYVLYNRFHLGEATILKDASLAFYYAWNVIRGRWEAAEERLAKNAEWAYRYALEILKGRFLLAEERILKSTKYGPLYKKHILTEKESNEMTVMQEKYHEYKLDLVKTADKMLKFWSVDKVFEKSLKKGMENFVFYEGPPSANGMPGIHHVMGRTIKDIFCRYKTMKGFKVLRKAGWDTHGLPVELKIEQNLNISKEDIGKKISVKAFNSHCRNSVNEYINVWDELTERIGYWVDTKNPYITCDKNYIESVWNLLKRLYDKNLLYKGSTIQPYSPAAGTALSSHELNMPGCYRDITELALTVKFKINRDFMSENFFIDNKPVFFLAWTTTPWTLPANAALAVNKSIDYVLMVTNQENYILSASSAKKLFPGQSPHCYITGDSLIKFWYKPLFQTTAYSRDVHTVIHADFVNDQSGTGIVHIAPHFGVDDQKVAKENNLPWNTVPIVNKQGKFIDGIANFSGMYVKDEETNKAIVEQLGSNVFSMEQYTHSYPHCWRTDKPIIYYPVTGWFIKTTAYKDKMIQLNKTINWTPESIGQGRFGNWLENLVDWNISRSRYWGTPLPIWSTIDGQERVCIGSLEELQEQMKFTEAKKLEFQRKQSLYSDTIPEIENPQIFDLHSPDVDQILLISPKLRLMRREPDVLDVWFDSGAMPFAQWHYPFENVDEFLQNFPADFIAEGVDQTRGWFFTLHALAVMLEDQVAFKNVISTGLVLDENGNKMAKRLGNVVDPFELLNKYGPDVIRWYLISSSNVWDDLKFNVQDLEEVKRKFFDTLHNVYSFTAMYSNLYQEGKTIDDSHQIDNWILSRLHNLSIRVETAYEYYDPTKAARLISQFVIDDLSNWYVRLNRKRLWNASIPARNTLVTCLQTLVKLMAPIAPFYADELHMELKGNASVHLEEFPVTCANYISDKLERQMEQVREICSMVNALRKKEKIKVKQPLANVFLPLGLLDEINDLTDIIKQEVNIKNIKFVDTTTFAKKAKPNYAVLGKKYGSFCQEIAEFIKTLKEFPEEILYKEFVITPEDMVISTCEIPGMAIMENKNLIVGLDTVITEELQLEGMARDFVSKVQNLRKERNLKINNTILLQVKEQPFLTQNEEYIRRELQIARLEYIDSDEILIEVID